jgi:hypothetical protein
MTNHLSFEVLNRLVDERETPIEEARTQRHLASCGRCRSELQWLKRIRGVSDGPSGIDRWRTADERGRNRAAWVY